MKQIIAAIIFFTLSASVYSDDSAATEAALSWLALIDEDKYSESWSQSAPYFQSAISKQDWVGALNGVRKPLGAVKKREVLKSKSRSSLPGAPDGEYIIFTLKASFENKAKAVETLTMVLTDQEWRAVGYFIK